MPVEGRAPSNPDEVILVLACPHAAGEAGSDRGNGQDGSIPFRDRQEVPMTTPDPLRQESPGQQTAAVWLGFTDPEPAPEPEPAPDPEPNPEPRPQPAIPAGPRGHAAPDDFLRAALRHR
jgi:hypothetical protein